ncbi:hypothetical protein OG948_53295 (plasmid) [Embleya sp. NBC_00888]|nr:hypothetical protein OG948_53295 [Embleya sp. NBC_00888]
MRDFEDLAKTGGHDSAVVLVTGAVVALMAIGGGAPYPNRRRGRPRA